jgi:class 3 adenylate cyclase
MAISFNLSKKFVLLVMLVTVTALGITSYMSFDYSTEILKGETLRLLFESRIEQNNILANDPMIQLLVSKMNQIPDNELKNFQDSNRRDFLIQVQAFQELIGFSIGFEDTKIIGNNGKVFFSLSGNTNENFIKNEFFQRGLKESFMEFESVDNGKKLVIVSPIFADDSKKGDEPIGVIISRMRTSAIDNILDNRSGLGETGEVYIVNNDFLMLSESRFFENAVFQQQVDTVAVQKCFNENEEYVGFYSDYREISIYGSSYCAQDLGIVLLAEMDEKELVAPIKILQTRILLTSLLIIMLVGVVAYFAAESISHPLRKLKNAANKIANGKFDVRTNITTGDEVGELSHAFDSMAQKLEESLSEIKEKEKVIKQLKGDMLLKFSQRVQNDCVGVIDMTDSTRISSKLSDDDVSKMYEIFLNFMAKIIRKYNGEVIKNIGDALMFRFPNMDSLDSKAMKNMLECCLSMIESHEELKNELNAKNIDALDYKISVTYGSVKVAESTTSNISDVFGPTVNRCFKINSFCPKNSIVIGSNLYGILKDFEEYEFTQFCSIEMKEKYDYSIFEVKRKK